MRLYRLGVAVRGQAGRGRGAAATAWRKRAVGSCVRVKGNRRVRWWRHGLFGEPDGRPPPHLTKAQARRTRSQDELELGIR